MRKTLPFYLLLLVIFGLLVLRLGQLTIVQGVENRSAADTQRIRIKEIPAERGIIFDKNKKPLVFNTPIFKKCPPEIGLGPIEKSECVGIDREESLKMEAEGKDNELVIGLGRLYPNSEATSNLLGYLGEVSQDDLQSRYCQLPFGTNDRYESGDTIGRTGLEEQYECELRGIKGGELVEVNTDGQTLRKIGRKEPVPGKDIQLSIDIELQKVAYDALGGKKGAVVVTSPINGEVLALVSSPGFDPNILSGATSSPENNSKIQEIFLNKDQPLFNRAISGVYPPGSTFKIVTTSAGVEENKITEQTKLEDSGVISIGAFTYSNWYFTQYGRTEGAINVVTALKRSNDIFFYKLGELVGAQKIVDWAKKFHFGRSEGIDMPEEAVGNLPDPSKEWYLGNTYHLAIGQGALGVTPLQLNQMTSVIASNGEWCKPHLLKSEFGNCQNIGLSQQTLKLILQGMTETCSPGGTAFPLFDFKPQVACKTGTAEFGDPKGKTHAWLTAFAPADKPEVVVTVLVEEGGEGSAVAAPIARKVLEQYFKNK